VLNPRVRRVVTVTTVTTKPGPDPASRTPDALWIAEVTVGEEVWSEVFPRVDKIMRSFAVGTRAQLASLPKA